MVMVERELAPEMIAEAAHRQAVLRGDLAGRRASLPLRYLRQQAHFTTPAADEAMATKAIEGGTGPTGRILERFGVTGGELADRLAVPAERVEALLRRPRRAPLVMLDGEDAQALRDDVTERGLSVTTRLVRGADWGRGADAALRFYRPPGFNLPTSFRDLLTVLFGIADAKPQGRFPLDGIVFPKVEHPQEVDLLYEVLERFERERGLPEASVRVMFLVEAGWAVAQLPQLAQRAAGRLAGLIFGLADYSADLGLPEIATHHPLADHARSVIVNVAGALGVPAIDGMTLAYPVADPALDAVSNRERFLDRMALVHRDAVRAHAYGMQGKWVGHPAQLFAVLLAYDQAFRPEALEEEARKLERYREAVEQDARGATMIEGVMSDRATDRHARALLRQAVALGRFDARRALDLGVIDGAELPEALALGDTSGEAHGG